jgi:hypothetical protein
MNFLADIWDGWKQIFQNLWSYVRAGYVWVVGIFLAVIAGLTSFLEWVTDKINDLATAIGEIILPSSDVMQSVGTWLEQINYVFPLQETFAIIVAVCVLWLTMLAVRVIKWVREMIIA